MDDFNTAVGPHLLDGMHGQLQHLLDEARRQGADACEARLLRRRSLYSTRVAGQSQSAKAGREFTVAVAVLLGQQKGLQITPAEDGKNFSETVAKALRQAREAAPDPLVGLADAARMPTSVTDLALFHDWSFDPEAASATVAACEQAALASDPRIVQVPSCYVVAQQNCEVYGNSHGFIGGYAGSTYQLTCVAKAAQAGSKRTCEKSLVQRTPAVLQAPELIGRQAAERALRLLGGRPVVEGDYPLICGPDAGTELLGGFLQAIQGGKVLAGQSFLAGCLGQTLFDQRIAIREYPSLPGGLGSIPFDADGVTAMDQAFVEAGRLRGYALNAETARGLNLTTTGNAVDNELEIARNLTLEAPALAYTALLASVARGVLVDAVKPIQLDLASGQFNLIGVGFWVEHGVIQHPLAPFVVSGNLKEAFAAISDVADDRPAYGRICTGSWLIERLHVRPR